MLQRPDICHHPNSVTDIGEAAFRYCSGLTSISIPNSVTSIGKMAFSRCSGLTSISIPNSVTSIGEGTFQYCSSLTSVNIGNSVTSIDNSTFASCTNITTVTLNSNAIVSKVFSSTSSLKDVFGNQVTKYIIGNSVTSIGSSAFYGCNGLTSVTIPNSVTSIGNNAFYYCSALTSVNISDLAAWCNISFSDSYSNPCYYAHHLYLNGTEVTDLTIPNSVSSIGSSAFYGCSGLTSVTIPNSVITIGSSAFYGCSGLTSVTIPNSVITIGSSAFYGCSGLTSVNIPNSVTSIGNSAFQGCSNLTSVTFGNNVTSIGDKAFTYTNLKKSIWLTNTAPSGYSNANGAVNYVANDQYGSLNNKIVYPFLSSMFEVDGIKYVPVSPSERICDAIDCTYEPTATNINISSTVSYRGINMSVKKVQPYVCCNNQFIESLTCNNDGEISQYAFSGCTNMTSLLLGNSVTSIGQYAFQGCSSLSSVIIPNSVTVLDSYSFSNCSSLANLTVGNQVNTFGQYAFSNCKSLPFISIPKSVKTINNYAFSGCSGLKTVIIADRDDALTLGSNGSSPLFESCPLDSVYIGGDITYYTSSSYGYSPFYRNTTLRTVVITDKETEISPNEFYGCTNLQSFTVGDGVTTFGDWAFSGCSSLKSLSFGTQLSTIGKEAFSDCTSVTKIVSKATTPPTCGTQALDDIYKWDCTLYVPTGCLSAYKTADQWKDFFFVEEGNGSGGTTENPDTKKCETPTIRYHNGLLTFDCATEGAVCQSTITDEDIASYSGNEVQLGVTYRICVYATKWGYQDSDVLVATLCWIDVDPQIEGFATNASKVRAHPVMIQSDNSVVTVSGVNDGTMVAVYTVSGQMVGSAKASSNQASITTNLRKGEIAIVKIGEKAVKVVMH